MTKGRVAALSAVLVAGGAVWAAIALPEDKNPPDPPDWEVEVETPGIVDVSDMLTAGVDLSSFELGPNQGLNIDSGDGRLLTYGDGHIDYMVTGDDGTQIGSRLGNMAGWFSQRESELVFEFDPAASSATVAWAEWVFVATPGVEQAGNDWVIRDVEGFLSDLPSAEPNGGSWIFDPELGMPGLLDATEFRFLYYWPEEGYTWVVDNVEDKAWLAAVDGSGAIVVAGALVDSGAGVEFREEPGLDDVARGSLNAALAVFPDGVLVAAPARELTARPAMHMPGAETALALRYGWCLGVCGVVNDYVIQPAKNRVVDPVIDGGRKYVPIAVGGLVDTGVGVYEIGAGAVTLDADRIQGGLVTAGDGLMVSGTAIYDYGTEVITRAILKDCGRPGPGPNSDGSGRPQYPDAYYGRLLPELQSAGPEGAEWIQRGLLAHAWMPGVKLSQGERCGEIIRITADLALFGPTGDPVEWLVDAARVQITYTLFYAEDGGVAWPVFGAHPGDNEGFSVGLVRSDRTDGRCGLTDPHFQLLGGKSAAHKDLGPLKATSDVVGVDWNQGNPCPAPPVSWGLGMRSATDFAPQTPDQSYIVWSSINKHGTYFHEGVCDSGLYRAEECVDGRDVYDLHHWVELVITDISDLENEIAECSDKKSPDDPAVKWPPAGDILHIGGMPWDGQDKAFYCTARHPDDGTGKYDVPGIRDADYADFVTAPSGPPEIGANTTCSGLGQRTTFDITGMFGNSDITVLVVDDSTALPTVLVDLSGTTDAQGRWSGSFDWGNNSIFLDSVRIDVSQSTPDGSRSLDIDVPAIAGCWPPTTEYSLSVHRSGFGSVVSSPGGISCGSDCSESYEEGVRVTLTASPASGSEFSGWSGACSGTGSCVVTMDSNTSVTANFDFESTNTYTLSVISGGSGLGSVSSNPGGISCGSDCSHTYDEGVMVTLTASPLSGSVFSGWSGGCSGTGYCVVTMSRDQIVTAVFDDETVFNRPPVAGDLYSTLESAHLGISLRYDVTEYSTDPDGDPVLLSDATCYASGCEMLESGPTYESSCCILVTVRPDGVGTVEIPVDFEVHDGRGGYDSGTLHITVNYPEGSSVPDVVGMPPTDAESVLSDFGYSNVRHECIVGYSGVAPEVISQDPAPGMQVPTSTLITLVSEGDPDYSGWWPGDCNWVEDVGDLEREGSAVRLPTITGVKPQLPT